MAPRKTKTTTSVKTTTKKNPWRSSHVPLPSWIMFWALILCTMALIVVNFSQAFAPAQVDAIDDTTAAQFAAIRASLEQQVANLQAQVSSTTAPSTPTCEAVQNPGPADSYIAYTDPKTSVSMKLPYSAKWGNGCEPLHATENGIEFGPLYGPGKFDSQISILTPDTKVPTSSKHTIISGLTVYTFPAGVQNEATWVAVGRTYTYMLTSGSWLTDAEAVKIIQSLKVVK